MTTAAPYPDSAFGSLGRERVLRVGYGAMQLEHVSPDDATSVLHRAVDLGVDHIDTAEFYGDGAVNRALHLALHPYPEHLQLVTKVGAEHGSTGLVPAQRPEQLRAAVDANLASLGADRLAVVNLRRLDAAPGIIATGDQLVDLDSQLAELIALRDEGKVGAIGLSNVTVAQVRQAAAAGIVCVQNLYNLLERQDEPTLVECERLGIAWVPYCPLGSAFAHWAKVTDSAVVIAHATRLGITPTRAALAWLLGHSRDILLIAGTRSAAHLADNIGAVRVELDESATVALDGVGQRGRLTE